MSDSEEINMDIDNTKTRDELTFIELLAEHVFDPSSITETSEDVNILELSEYSTGVPYSGSVTTRSAPSHPLEEPSLVHNNSLMEVEPATESLEVEEEKTEPVTEPIVEVEEEKTDPIVEVEEEKTEPVTEPIVEVEEEKTDPIVEVEEGKTEPVTEPIVEVEEEKTEPVTEPIVEVEEEKTEPVTEPIVEVEEEKTEPVTEPIVEVEEEKTEPIVEVEEQKVEPVKVEEVKVDETPVVEEPKGVFNKLTSSLFSICNWFVKK